MDEFGEFRDGLEEIMGEIEQKLDLFERNSTEFQEFRNE